MSSEAELVINIWEAMRDHLPVAKRPELAKDLLYAVIGYGFDSVELASIVDEDIDLTNAYEEVFAADEDEDEDDESFDEDD
jgi:3-polyprenyl-4-hydroxybenzoate decarboxylase